MKILFSFLIFFLTVCQFGLAQQNNQEQDQGGQDQQQQNNATQLQEPPPPTAIPAMRNVFFNTLWGSMTGGLLQMSYHVIDDSKDSDERFSIQLIANKFFEGATVGGLVGVAVGLILSFNNITYYDRDLISTSGFAGLNTPAPYPDRITLHRDIIRPDNLPSSPEETIAYRYPVLHLKF